MVKYEYGYCVPWMCVDEKHTFASRLRRERSLSREEQSRSRSLDDEPEAREEDMESSRM